MDIERRKLNKGKISGGRTVERVSGKNGEEEYRISFRKKESDKGRCRF